MSNRTLLEHMLTHQKWKLTSFCSSRLFSKLFFMCLLFKRVSSASQFYSLLKNFIAFINDSSQHSCLSSKNSPFLKPVENLFTFPLSSKDSNNTTANDPLNHESNLDGLLPEICQKLSSFRQKALAVS